jgi:hypothetical protein
MASDGGDHVAVISNDSTMVKARKMRLHRHCRKIYCPCTSSRVVDQYLKAVEAREKFLSIMNCMLGMFQDIAGDVKREKVCRK